MALGEVSYQGKRRFHSCFAFDAQTYERCVLEGCSGANLDCLAREVFWKERLNFNHGTGHGVGYLLNIHEPD